jgi:hypothetical protein
MSGSNNIIKFPGQSKIRDEEQRALPAFTGCSTGYGYTRRNRQNPLRQKLQLVEIAVVEVNKVQYQHSLKEREWIREGVEAARALVDELAHAAEPFLIKRRRTNSEAMARRREFKRAMRQRIKDIAASRDLSEEDIKAVMTLKHHEIIPFTEKHGVSVDWLLTGEGRIFKNEVGRTSGDKFTALVAELPIADQQVIRTMVRELIKDRL